MAADRVTDQMVEAALKAWQETNVTFGDLHSLMHAAIESALRAEAGAVRDLLNACAAGIIAGDGRMYFNSGQDVNRLRAAIAALAQARRADRE
jgi:hypothetical protein